MLLVAHDPASFPLVLDHQVLPWWVEGLRSSAVCDNLKQVKSLIWAASHICNCVSSVSSYRLRDFVAYPLLEHLDFDISRVFCHSGPFSGHSSYRRYRSFESDCKPYISSILGGNAYSLSMNWLFSLKESLFIACSFVRSQFLPRLSYAMPLEAFS